MTLYEFQPLSLNEQAETTWKKGVFLVIRRCIGYSVALYQLDSFYVEVCYNTLENTINNIRSFTTTDLLEPYFKCIDISAVMSE